MIKRFIIIVFLLAAVGCSMNPYTAAVDAITGSNSGPSLELKNENKDVYGENNETEEIKVAQSEKTQNAQTIINNSEIPPTQLLILSLLMCIGWLLPSPHEIWRGFLNLFKLRVVK